jgi:hypothetical protein
MSLLIASAVETALDLAALIFLASGCAKLTALGAFREGLLYIPYMRVSWSYVVGWTLPAVELLVATGLLLNVFVAKVAALVLLALISGVVLLVLGKRLKVPCNCFGRFGERYLSAANLRTSGFLALAVLAALPLPERVDPGQSLPVAAFVIFAYLALGELLHQQRFLADLRKQGLL